MFWFGWLYLFLSFFVQDKSISIIVMRFILFIDNRVTWFADGAMMLQPFRLNRNAFIVPDKVETISVYVGEVGALTFSSSKQNEI